MSQSAAMSRFPRFLIVMGMFFVGWIGPESSAAPIDLGIADDADYARLTDAIRATEYFREDYIVQSRTPRVVASVASLSAYAQLNPLASQAQLQIFVDAFDASVQSEYAGDPQLYRSVNFMTALRFTTVNKTGLEGTNTHVGPLAAQLLGVVVPAPDNFDVTQRRMVRFGQGLTMRYTHHRAFSELLVYGLFGITQNGADRPELSTTLNQYLTSAGYEPNYGSVNTDPRFIDVNTAIQSLPEDFASYSTAMNQSLASNVLVGMVDLHTEQVQLEIDSRILTMSDAVDAEPSIQDGFDMSQNQAVLDQLASDLRDELQETSYHRSSMFGATLLLGQSPLDELGDYSVMTADYNASLLEASDSMAEVQLGLGVLTNLSVFAVAASTGDPVSAVGAIFGLVADGIGIADHAGALGNTPSVDEQIYAQLIELRVQVEAMRVEMHERFDRIEQQLNFMYDQMVIGFSAIGDQIGDLAGQNEAILREMHVVRSQLSQLESALFGVAEDILLTDLTDAANTVLDYRDENNIDLAYANQNPSFVTASEDFFTFATVTARSQAFAGSRTNPLVTLTTADQYLSANPIARYLNDLAVLPQSLGLSPLTFTTLSAPEPWAQSASAYAQLAIENSWYFAFRYESQLEDYLADPQNESLPELDEIIEVGQALVNLGDSARDPMLFDALVNRYKQKAATLQSEINSIMFTEMTAQKLRWSAGEELAMIDLWDTDGVQTDTDTLFAQYSSSHQPAFSSMDDSSPNWGPNGSQLEIDSSLTYFERARLVSGENTDHANRAVLFEYLNQLDQSPKYAHELRWDATVPAPLHRGSSFSRSPDFSIIHWVDTNSNPNITDMQPIHSRRIDAQIDVWGDLNGFEWIPIELYWDENNPRDCAYKFFINNDDVEWKTLELAMPFGSTQGLSIQNTNVDANEFSWLENECADNWQYVDNINILRFHIWSDSAYSHDSNALVTGHIFEFLTQYREGNIRPLINAAFADPLSSVALAAQELDHTVALLNAYITLAAPEAVTRSEILRSALRATPGQSEIGLRSNDVLQLVLDFSIEAAARDPRAPADPELDFHVLDQILNSRIDFVHDEINRAIEMPLESPAYIEWMLKELNDVRDRVFAPAHDDLYAAGSTLIVDATQGLLANDTMQEYRSVIVDPEYGTNPSHGDLMVNADGSFEYTPDPGYIGEDSFTYRLVGTVIDGTPVPADGQFVSDSATVVLIAESSGCSAADLTGDGMINFFDVSSFLLAFTGQEPAADFTNDGSWNFFDVSAFLLAYAEGCP